MHVQLLAISPVAVHDSRDNNELVLGDKIPYTAFIFLRLVAAVCLDVELQRGGQWQREEKQQAAAQLQEADHCDGEAEWIEVGQIVA